MKSLLTGLIALVACASAATAGDYTSGYVRSNGTYVSGYHRTTPNYTVRDNYSYKGNYNPYTGSTGTNYYRKAPSSAYYQGYTGSTYGFRTR